MQIWATYAEKNIVYGIPICEPSMATSEYTPILISLSQVFANFNHHGWSNFHVLHYRKFEDSAIVSHVQFLLPVQSGERLVGIISNTTFQDVDKGLGENNTL